MTKAHDIHAPGTRQGAAAGPALEREADRKADQVAAATPEAGYRSAAGGNADGALGAPLEPALRREMEGHFGHDFSQVRIHAGDRAARMADAASAAAFTVGSDVVFNSGRFAPGTPVGRRLLAHELTHVVQQAGMAAPVVQRQPLGATGTGTGAGAADDGKAALTWESYRQSITLDGFDSDSATLTSEHIDKLDEYKLRLQMLLGRYPESFVSIIGHTDATDSEAHNKTLGQRRADAVKARLTSGDNAVPADALSAGSLGETALAVPVPGREPRNRRVEIIPHLRRRERLLSPPAPAGTFAPSGGAGSVGGFGGIGGIGGYKPPGTVPNPFDPSLPVVPGLGKPPRSWIEDALDRDPLIRGLPPWMGDKIKDALKDGDEMLAKKVIDMLPLDDKMKGLVQAVVKGLLKTAKGQTWKPPEAPPRSPDFGPAPEFPKFPGETIIPGPKFEF